MLEAVLRTMKTQCAVVLFAACLIAVTARSAYQLPYGAELLHRQIVNTFSCAGRPYGYYADVNNDCKIFHVCVPVSDEQGNLVEEAHFSFMCGNQTVFSQDTLACAMQEDAYPCEQAESLYDASNAEFGRIPEDTEEF
ncbi:U-scoloptoxin(01)-Cw1a-like isoform X2 [Eriocheir sinensis]|uniref:U-scoloptoxin(01)-Cw1a-like isoform X2 n=2 Tax=Eriocheir sinensis TaxID=95602 RepID=UPI0021C878EE|nr:U-scoloptoxin(01)-Cw1a-like isoform X2 [Eriocheir sinensis]